MSGFDAKRIFSVKNGLNLEKRGFEHTMEENSFQERASKTSVTVFPLI